MKSSLFILILLFSQILNAKSIEMISGGLTYHTFIPDNIAENFTHKWSADGKLIYNQLYGFGYIDNSDIFFSSHKFFIGQNSIGEAMGGYLYSFGGHVDGYDLGLGTGGYYQNNELFKDKGIDMVTIAGFIPLLGIELNKKFMINNTKYLKINTFTTIFLINASLSLGENF